MMTTPAPATRSQLTLAVLVLVLAGCSTSFAYKRLDRLIPWYVDGYVDLDREQKHSLKRSLQPLLHWHRVEELTAYRDLLERIERDLQAEVSAARVRSWFDELYAAARRVESAFFVTGIEFGETLSVEQVEEFVASLWQRQRELEEEYLRRSDAAYREDSYDILEKNLRRFVRRLEPAQAQRLQALTMSLQRFDRAWLEEREAWLSKLATLLQRQPGWQQALLQAHAERLEQRTPLYREIIEHNMRMISAGLADVFNQLNETQAARLQRKLVELQADLQELIEITPNPETGTIRSRQKVEPDQHQTKVNPRITQHQGYAGRIAH